MAILNANYIARLFAPLFPYSLQRGSSGDASHRRFAPIQKRHGLGRGQAADGLRLSRPDHSRARHPHDPADRKRIEGGTGPFRRCPHRHPRRVSAGYSYRASGPASNLLKNAPHTAAAVVKEPWDRPYSRERAAFPAPWDARAKILAQRRRIHRRLRKTWFAPAKN